MSATHTITSTEAATTTPLPERAKRTGEQFEKEFQKFVEEGRNIREAELLEKLQDSAHSVICTKVSSQGLWHEFGMHSGKYGMIEQDLYLTFVVSGDLFGITQKFDVEIHLQYITDNFETQTHNTWIKVSSTQHGNKEFSNWGDRGRHTQWFANLYGDENDDEERKHILEEVSESFGSPLHLAAAERCMRLIFATKLGFSYN